MTAPTLINWDLRVAQQALLDSASRFHANRPPCPQWCDQSVCKVVDPADTFVTHRESPDSVGIEPGQGDDWQVLIAARKNEDDSGCVGTAVDVDVVDNETGHAIFWLSFTPAQARQMAAALINSADLADQEANR